MEKVRETVYKQIYKKNRFCPDVNFLIEIPSGLHVVAFVSICINLYHKFYPEVLKFFIFKYKRQQIHVLKWVIFSIFFDWK